MDTALSRFLDAQGSGTYEQALRELRAGRKHGHWPIDAVKLRSSMTLFARADGDPAFRAVLDKFFAGREDDATHRLLGL